MGLRKASGAHVTQSGFWIFRRHVIHASRSLTFTYGDRAYRQLLDAVEADGAAEVGADGGRALWMTADGFYWEDDGLSAEEVGLLAWDRLRRQEARLDRLRTIRARDEDLESARRERIPDEVRAFVWQRDDGRCVRCGAEDDLQFDHVIPVAKGGGNAVDNIQVLCGDCNRQKSDSII